MLPQIHRYNRPSNNVTKPQNNRGGDHGAPSAVELLLLLMIDEYDGIKKEGFLAKFIIRNTVEKY